MMAEDATALVEALLAIIDAARAYLPPDGIGKDAFIARGLEATDNPKIIAALAHGHPLAGRLMPRAVPYLKPLIHSVSACEPRPSAASVAALYPPGLIAGHDACGQGVRVEVGAQARHGVGEVAHVDVDERALFCPGQLFLTALHAADSPVCRGAGSYAKRQRRQAGAGRHERQPVGA
jgi:hypothetical protein